MDILEEILKKIDNKTITLEDFNRLIKESTPEGVQEKIRRRVQRNATDSHIDRKGHQPLSAPNMTSRVVPKRKPSNNQKNNGRGDIGRKHSADTVKAMYEEEQKEAKTDDKYFDRAKELSGLVKDKDVIKYLMDNNLIDSNFAHAILKELDDE